MLNGNYRSMEFIVERLYRNSLIFQKANVSEYDLAEYVGEAMLLIGALPQYQENFSLVTIDSYRGKLPCSPVEIITIRMADSGHGLTKSTNDFSGSTNKPSGQDVFLADHEYTIKGQIIHIDTLKEGTIEVKFVSLMTDENGFPMIPDNERFSKAVESYIKYMVYQPMWEVGDIRDAVFYKAERDWLFYVNSAKTKALIPNVDGMEAIKNNMVRLIRDFRTRTNTGRGLGVPEQRKGYNIK